MDDFLTNGRTRSRRTGKKEKKVLPWLAVFIGLLGIPVLSPLYAYFYWTPLYLAGLLVSVKGWQNRKNTVNLIGILLNSISLLWTLVAWGLVISLWLGI